MVHNPKEGPDSVLGPPTALCAPPLHRDTASWQRCSAPGCSQPLLGLGTGWRGDGGIAAGTLCDSPAAPSEAVLCCCLHPIAAEQAGGSEEGRGPAGSNPWGFFFSSDLSNNKISSLSNSSFTNMSQLTTL